MSMNNSDKRQNDPLDPIAEALHNGWRQHREGLGFTHGERGQPNKHPHICDWRDNKYKSEAERNGDRFQAALLLHWWTHKKLTLENLPEMIHEAQREWISIQGHTNEHDKPYAEAHSKSGPYEHDNQAKLVWQILTEGQAKGVKLCRLHSTTNCKV